MAKLKAWRVTVPTRGYTVYEVQATDADDAKERVACGKAEMTEEGSDWDDSDDWEVDEVEE